MGKQQLKYLTQALLLFASLNQTALALDEWAIGEQITHAYDKYRCGETIPLDEAQPGAYAQLERLHGLRLDQRPLPILIGNSSTWGGGTIVFYQQAGQWQARVMEMGTSATQVYTNPEQDAYWIFFMHTSEAPGNIQYLHLTPETARCGDLIGPDELNQPGWAMEFVELDSFNLDAAGKGIVLGSAVLDQETENAHTQWYAYHTTDNGKTWSAPQATQAPSQPPQGIWLKTTSDTPAATQLKALLAQPAKP